MPLMRLTPLLPLLTGLLLTHAGTLHADAIASVLALSNASLVVEEDGF